MRGLRVPRILGFKNVLNNRIARGRNSLICDNLVYPGYSGLKIIQLMIWLIAALLHYSLICLHLISLAYLGLKLFK